MDDPQNHGEEWKKPEVNDHMLYESIYMKYPEEENLIEIESRAVVALGWVRK